MILTVDLGTSVTKAVVWDDDGPLAIGRSALDSTYGPDNRAEQDPASWWASVVAACAAARSALGARAAAAFGSVTALGFAAARQTFVPVAADATPVGPALLWSDRRAGAEAVSLARSFGEEGATTLRRRTGVVLDAGSVAAKVTWLARHEPQRLHDARWLLSPRDLLAWRLTGEVATDHTLASATGLFELAGGALVPGLVDDVADRLPVPRPSDAILGGLLAGPAGELGLRGGIPVVIGAGDRACEVLGTGATEAWPMVSWGTTANVSVPVLDIGDTVRATDATDATGATNATGATATGPAAMIVTRGALEGWLLEGGLSAAGSLLDWLGRLAGLDGRSLMDRARSSPPGSRGVIVLPWWGGARAPWWRDTARGAVVGLSFDHDIGDMARAVVESVAWDVTRCLESATLWRGEEATPPAGLVLAGGGAHVATWTEILSAVTGLPARRRRSGEAASAGAAMLVARATGAQVDFDRIDPVEAETAPDAEMVSWYRTQRPAVDAAAAAVIDLNRSEQ